MSNWTNSIRAKPQTDADRDEAKAFRKGVGQRLVAARKALGVKRIDWILRHDVIPSRWSQWETGVAMADLRTLTKLCDDHPQLTMDYFLRGRIRVKAASEPEEAEPIEG